MPHHMAVSNVLVRETWCLDLQFVCCMEFIVSSCTLNSVFQTHFISTVPAYRNPKIDRPVTVQIVVEAHGGVSEAAEFVYHPGKSEAIFTLRR